MKHLIIGGIAALATAGSLAAPANAAGEFITYVVESNGPLLSISYYDGMNEMTQVVNSGVSSWTANIRSRATYQLMAIAAQTQGTQVTCRIIKNGMVTAERTTVGRYTMSVCASA